MTAQALLRGRRVLVVEDDYFLASDAARALEGAGAAVLGPCPSEQAALGELARARPDAVLLDINLGDGASFRLAEALRDELIPFAFVTGYDRATIPARFADVGHVIKPVQLNDIVDAVAKLLRAEARG
jgi:CheY-like chemotaxis protein